LTQIKKPLIVEGTKIQPALTQGELGSVRADDSCVSYP